MLIQFLNIVENNSLNSSPGAGWRRLRTVPATAGTEGTHLPAGRITSRRLLPPGSTSSRTLQIRNLQAEAGLGDRSEDGDRGELGMKNIFSIFWKKIFELIFFSKNRRPRQSPWRSSRMNFVGKGRGKTISSEGFGFFCCMCMGSYHIFLTYITTMFYHNFKSNCFRYGRYQHGDTDLV